MTASPDLGSGAPPALPPLFPFAAIAGQPLLCQALLLAAIDPQLGGVLIEGPRGTAKSTAARALAELIDAAPFVTLPLGASLEHLAGSLDLGQAMAGHALKFAPGLLARAHGGVLYVDEINLLPDALVDVLLDAAASGVNVVERDGISHRHAARFVLVGTMNPEEGQLRPQLLDRLGLCVRLANVQDAAQRQAIVRARLLFDADPQPSAPAMQTPRPRWPRSCARHASACSRPARCPGPTRCCRPPERCALPPRWTACAPTWCCCVPHAPGPPGWAMPRSRPTMCRPWPSWYWCTAASRGAAAAATAAIPTAGAIESAFAVAGTKPAACGIHGQRRGDSPPSEPTGAPCRPSPWACCVSPCLRCWPARPQSPERPPQKPEPSRPRATGKGCEGGPAGQPAPAGPGARRAAHRQLGLAAHAGRARRPGAGARTSAAPP